MKQRTERDSKNSLAFNARPNVALMANQDADSLSATDCTELKLFITFTEKGVLLAPQNSYTEMNFKQLQQSNNLDATLSIVQTLA
jgi:hypothetical protein